MSTATKEPTKKARYLILDGRKAKALAGACASEDNRPILNNGRVRENGIVEATNGHILARVLPTFHTEDGEYFLDGDVEKIEEQQEFLIPKDSLKLPKASEYLRLDLETGELAVLGKDQVVRAIIPNGTTTESYFPDTCRVYPRDLETVRVRFSGEYLKLLAKIAKAEGDKGITLEIPAKEKDYRKATEWTAGEASGLLMPMILP